MRLSSSAAAAKQLGRRAASSPAFRPRRPTTTPSACATASPPQAVAPQTRAQRLQRRRPLARVERLPDAGVDRCAPARRGGTAASGTPPVRSRARARRGRRAGAQRVAAPDRVRARGRICGAVRHASRPSELRVEAPQHDAAAGPAPAAAPAAPGRCRSAPRRARRCGRCRRPADAPAHRAARRAAPPAAAACRSSVSRGSVATSPPWRVLSAALGSCITAPTLSRSSVACGGEPGALGQAHADGAHLAAQIAGLAIRAAPRARSAARRSSTWPSRRPRRHVLTRQVAATAASASRPAVRARTASASMRSSRRASSACAAASSARASPARASPRSRHRPAGHGTARLRAPRRAPPGARGWPAGRVGQLQHQLPRLHRLTVGGGHGRDEAVLVGAQLRLVGRPDHALHQRALRQRHQQRRAAARRCRRAPAGASALPCPAAPARCDAVDRAAWRPVAAGICQASSRPHSTPSVSESWPSQTTASAEISDHDQPGQRRVGGQPRRLAAGHRHRLDAGQAQQPALQQLLPPAAAAWRRGWAARARR